MGFFYNETSKKPNKTEQIHPIPDQIKKKRPPMVRGMTIMMFQNGKSFPILFFAK